MNIDHRAIAAAQSPELDLSAFGSAEKPFITLPSFRSLHNVAAPVATRSDVVPGASAAAPNDAPDIPGAAADFIVALLAERRRQVVEFGHTPDKDLGKRPGALLSEIQRCISYARDDAQFHRPGWRDACRKHCIQTAATAMAMVEYLDAGGGE